MESAQRELVSLLLDHIHSLGLISDFTYSGAVDLEWVKSDIRPRERVPLCGIALGFFTIHFSLCHLLANTMF